MKFIVDAQLPEKLKDWLSGYGVDVKHTNDLSFKERTPDMEIIKLCSQEERVVITKDTDFFKYHLIHGEPERILIIATGNIRNSELFELFENNFPMIFKQFESGDKIVELNQVSIITHE